MNDLRLDYLIYQIKYPMEHGIIIDWEDMERIWNFVYTDELRTLSEEVDNVVRSAGKFLWSCFHSILFY